MLRCDTQPSSVQIHYVPQQMHRTVTSGLHTYAGDPGGWGAWCATGQRTLGYVGF
jgi:hypothetical protein